MEKIFIEKNFKRKVSRRKFSWRTFSNLKETISQIPPHVWKVSISRFSDTAEKNIDVNRWILIDVSLGNCFPTFMGFSKIVMTSSLLGIG